MQFENKNLDVITASIAAFYKLTTCDGLAITTLCGQPAKPGDKIVIYFTGGGLATPNGDPSGKPVPTGVVVPINGSVLYKTVQTCQLMIGGIAAPVSFCGIAPGTQTEYQLNATIPTTVQPGNAVTAILTIGNSTDTVTIAVQSAN
jgi:uncharacterized protein (TIGR03437 family)